jgi:hypothetical protein
MNERSIYYLRSTKRLHYSLCYFLLPFIFPNGRPWCRLLFLLVSIAKKKSIRYYIFNSPDSQYNVYMKTIEPWKGPTNICLNPTINSPCRLHLHFECTINSRAKLRVKLIIHGWLFLSLLCFCTLINGIWTINRFSSSSFSLFFHEENLHLLFSFSYRTGKYIKFSPFPLMYDPWSNRCFFSYLSFEK